MAARARVRVAIGAGPATWPNRRLAVRLRGLEPPRALAHGDLNAARLPIPPQPRVRPTSLAKASRRARNAFSPAAFEEPSGCPQRCRSMTDLVDIAIRRDPHAPG